MCRLIDNITVSSPRQSPQNMMGAVTTQQNQTRMYNIYKSKRRPMTANLRIRAVFPMLALLTDRAMVTESSNLTKEESYMDEAKG